MENRILNIVTSGNGLYYYVLEHDFKYTYVKHGDILIGSDETETFYDTLKYQPCGGNPNFGGNYAFGGRKFDLQMKDGSITQCYGQYWSGGVSEAEEVLGIKLKSFPHNTNEGLKKCYVFFSGLIDETKLTDMHRGFYERNAEYVHSLYWDYEKLLNEDKV